VSRGAKVGIAGGLFLLVAVGAFFFLRDKKLPVVDRLLPEAAVCPLTGEEPRRESLVERPAVGVKIENAAAARPLSGLEDADLVYEELVEGGETRFLAIFHCGDAPKAGPIRSARIVDPSLLKPLTQILGYSGANDIVIAALEAADIVGIHEDNAGEAMERVPRAGVSFEHTLYADTAQLRRTGRRDYSEPPPEDVFAFGDLPDGTRGRRARTITLNFGGASTITYTWTDGRWARAQDGAPFMAESGEQIGPTNVLVEEHVVNLSREIVDSAGNPSIEIADETGSGRAVLFRDGRAITGRWVRESVDAAVRFETRSGDEMVFAPGSIWIELVPGEEGEVKGSFSYER
jgi:hypothetical protein